MSVSNPQKTVSPVSLSCGGKTTVTISFDAAAELASSPADLVLLMDRSYSMNPQRMFHAKKSAQTLIRMMGDADPSGESGQIGGGSRMGIITFSTQAETLVPMTTDIGQLTTGISALTSSGDTNHRAAFEAAEKMFDAKGTNRQIVLMFTDGITSQGGDATAVTDRMKASGMEIYCIGLLDDPAPLNSWASEPLAAHVSYTGDEKELEHLFERTAGEVLLSGAKDVVISEEVSPDFKITELHAPSTGVAEITGPRTLQWTMEQVGLTTEPVSVSLSFEVMHTGAVGGTLQVNQSLLYQDREGHALTFPAPTADVSCTEDPLYPEPCPAPSAIVVPGCQDAVRIRLDDTVLMSLGRIIQLDLTLKAICPGKRLAVSVILTEIGDENIPLPRGIRHLLIPAQEGEGCRDLILSCISFSVPEALTDHPGSICRERLFEARVLANYIDTDYSFCRNCTQPDRI